MLSLPVLIVVLSKPGRQRNRSGGMKMQAVIFLPRRFAVDLVDRKEKTEKTKLEVNQTSSANHFTSIF